MSFIVKLKFPIHIFVLLCTLAKICVLVASADVDLSCKGTWCFNILVAMYFLSSTEAFL